MTLNEILESKGRGVHSIAPTATLAEVVARLVKHNVGSLVVCAGTDMVGIITERDILRTCAAQRGTLETVRVEEVMTRNVVTAAPDDRVEDVMGLMTQKRIRHLPVLHREQLVGMISIGDVVKAQHDRLSLENHYLKSYIQS